MSVLDSTVDSPLPTAVIIIGMAGSGKTSLMQRLLAHLSSASVPHYSLNLDPAVTSLPYTPNIDIRDTVNYKQVMQQYALGPNGAILTSLNLFATRFDQVLQLVDKRTAKQAATVNPLQLVLADTPGQIEIFTWSASGVIISESLASSYPTVLLYVLDTPRCQRPDTFMSNMLYACSIMYKSQLPFLLVFNKTDIVSHHTAVQWMTDYEAFTAALNSANDAAGSSDGSGSSRGGYMTSLTRSMSLVLDEFYRTLSHVGVSAVTGDGVDELLEAVQRERQRYYTDFLPGLRVKVERRQREEEERKEKMREKLRRDRDGGSTGKRVVMDMGQRSAGEDAAGEEDEEDLDEAEEQDDVYERQLAEQREKVEYEEFVQKLRNNRGRLGDDDEQKNSEQ